MPDKRRQLAGARLDLSPHSALLKRKQDENWLDPFGHGQTSCRRLNPTPITLLSASLPRHARQPHRLNRDSRFACG
jgi:hypothetical protein